MKFRPCIDIKNGKVVQIVGSTLQESRAEATDTAITNFESSHDSSYFAKLYKKDAIYGGHVISLGSGNHDAAISALNAFAGGLQFGGGINPDNAAIYLDAGASHVIVTSYLFSDGDIDMDRVKLLVKKIGKKNLVLDFSCRKRDEEYWIVTDRWQKFTKVSVNQKNLEQFAKYCDEFLVHGVDVEGKMAGIESYLVEILGRYSPIPVTYAGGVKSFSDLDLVKRIGCDRVDLTIGSALDIFGGTIPYKEVVKWHKSNQ
ncbi:MAG: phosphoribosylformimino-5-aminoimidazole carboxamide ribotide isomerase [Desulfamplus sp.]|nr:phosphoribosylformimino-5-aminoimidazole carboxamide ribotide isomerase [Desulfamplus sp.]